MGQQKCKEWLVFLHVCLPIGNEDQHLFLRAELITICSKIGASHPEISFENANEN